MAVLRKTRSVSFSPKGKHLPGSREEGLANKSRASHDRVEFWLPSYEYFQHFAEILNWRYHRYHKLVLRYLPGLISHELHFLLLLMGNIYIPSFKYFQACQRSAL